MLSSTKHFSYLNQFHQFIL